MVRPKSKPRASFLSLYLALYSKCLLVHQFAQNDDDPRPARSATHSSNYIARLFACNALHPNQKILQFASSLDNAAPAWVTMGKNKLQLTPCSDQWNMQRLFWSAPRNGRKLALRPLERTNEQMVANISPLVEVARIIALAFCESTLAQT